MMEKRETTIAYFTTENECVNLINIVGGTGSPSYGFSTKTNIRSFTLVWVGPVRSRSRLATR